MEVQRREVAGQPDELLGSQVRIDPQDALAGHAVVEVAEAVAGVGREAAVQIDLVAEHRGRQRAQIVAIGESEGRLTAAAGFHRTYLLK